MKKLVIVLLILLVLSGCAYDPVPGESQPPAKLTVTLLASGDFDQRPEYAGVLAACQGLRDPRVTLRTLTCAGEFLSDRLVDAATESDVVILLGEGFGQPLSVVAKEFPAVRFILVGSQTHRSGANVLCITFSQREAAFLAGYAAARLSKTGTVAAVAGDEAVSDILSAYRQGAQYADPQIRIQTRTLGTWTDPAAGKAAALALRDLGADVLFQIAGQSGIGATEAAGEGEMTLISTDPSQPGICTVVTDAGTAVRLALEKYLKEGDRCGLFGTSWLADLPSGLVTLKWAEDPSLPNGLTSEVEALSQKIIAGLIPIDKN